VQQQQPAQAAARRPASAPRQRSLAATAPTYGGQQRPAVHERLYESGLMAKHKLDAERRQRERDLTAATKSDKVVMSQVRTLAGLRCLQCRCTAQHSPTAVDAALPCCTCSSRGLGMLSDVSSAGGTAAAALEWHMWAAAHTSSMNAAAGNSPRPLTRWSCSLGRHVALRPARRALYPW
jgi:hypothetical protein